MICGTVLIAIATTRGVTTKVTKTRLGPDGKTEVVEMEEVEEEE